MDNQPIIDWELGVKLAGGNRGLAEDILQLLMRDLEKDILALNEYYQTMNYEKAMQLAHKLHGALSYCGLPRLKKVVADIESNFKKNAVGNLSELFKQLNLELKLVIKAYRSKS